MSTSLSETEENAVLMRITLQAAGEDVAGKDIDQLRAMYQARNERQAAEKKTEENARKYRLEKSLRESQANRLSRAGIDPQGMSPNEITAKLIEVDERLADEHRQAQIARTRQQDQHRAETLLQKAQCPPRHMLNASSVNDDPRWVNVRDDIVNALSGGGFLIALLGKRGTGKTQLAVSVIRKACGKLLSCRYIKAYDLFRGIRSTFNPRDKGDDSEQDVVDELAGYDLLVIDEAHQRGETDWENNTLVNLLDRRYDEMKFTILIANQSKSEFATAIGDSIVSRIHETGEAIVCDWESYRKPGTWRQS